MSAVNSGADIDVVLLFVRDIGFHKTNQQAIHCSRTEMAVAANEPGTTVDPANAIYVNQGDDEPVQMESLCMNCHENVRPATYSENVVAVSGSTLTTSTLQGITTMLLTHVPHFRDIMVASFECQHCNLRYYITCTSNTVVWQGLLLSIAKTCNCLHC